MDAGTPSDHDAELPTPDSPPNQEVDAGTAGRTLSNVPPEPVDPHDSPTGDRPPWWWAAALFAGLLVALVLYLRFRIDPRLLYLKSHGLVVLDRDFLRQFLDYPGRPTEYLSLILRDLYWFPWVGAMAASALVVLVSFCTRAIFVRTTPESRGFGFTLFGVAIALLPAILAVVAFNGYDPVDLVDLAVAMVLGLTYTLVFPRWHVMRAVVFVVLLVLSTWVNPGASPLFASLCGLFEVARKRRYLTGVLLLAAGVLPIVYVATHAFQLGGAVTWTLVAPLLSPKPRLLPLVLLGLLSLLCVVAALRWKSEAALFVSSLVILSGLQWNLSGSMQGPLCFVLFLAPALSWLAFRSPAVRRWRPRRTVAIGILGAVIAACLVVALPTVDEPERSYLELKRSCRDRDWQAALVAARRMPVETYLHHLTAYSMLHRALYHAGRLPYELLRYPIHLTNMLPAPQPSYKITPLVESDEIADTSLDLGLVNHAELMAINALDTVESSGHAFRVLVLVYIAKGNLAAARPILGMLKKTIAHRRWAERCSELIDDPSALSTDLRIATIRSRMIRVDEPSDAGLLTRLLNKTWDWTPVLKRLLRVNPSNRMAFEYLMSYYLLEGRPAAVVENMPNLSRFGYREIPTLYQEAILTYYIETGGRLEGREQEHIDPALARLYLTLRQIYEQSGRNPAAAYMAVADRFGQTYFTYYMWLRRQR